MIVRREQARDADAIHHVQSLAFGQPNEAQLVRKLRADGDIIDGLSLVCEVDGSVVGHVVCSRGHLDGTISSAGLGPIGVLPDLQAGGVGSALMRAVVGAADSLGEPFIALLGAPDYYHRFGFVASTTLGIAAPDPAWGKFFQIRTLSAYEPALHGSFSYAPAFDAI